MSDLSIRLSNYPITSNINYGFMKISVFINYNINRKTRSFLLLFDDAYEVQQFSFSKQNVVTSVFETCNCNIQTVKFSKIVT